jgi:hypothetical protein
MSTLKERWLQRRQIVRSLMPSIKIENARLRFYKRKNYYEIVVRGEHLRPAAIPPAVSVHDVAVTNLRFSSDATELRGTLSALPDKRDLLIDLGFDRKELQLSSRVTTVPSLHYVLELFLDFIRRLFKRPPSGGR